MEGSAAAEVIDLISSDEEEPPAAAAAIAAQNPLGDDDDEGAHGDAEEEDVDDEDDNVDLSEVQAASLRQLLEFGLENVTKVQILRVVSVAVGLSVEDIVPTALTLLDGEKNEPLVVTEEEASASLKAGAAIGARVEKMFLDEHERRTWFKATVARFDEDTGHLLKFDDGQEERVRLNDDVDWRLLKPPPSRKRRAAGSSLADATITTTTTTTTSGGGSSSDADVDEEAAAGARRLPKPAPTVLRNLPEPPFSAVAGAAAGVTVQLCEEAGWAHCRGLDVGGVQQWFTERMRTQHREQSGRRLRASAGHELSFMPWGSDYSTDPGQQKTREAEVGKKDRTLLLDRSQYPQALQRHFDEHFYVSPAEREFGKTHSWPSVPNEMLDLDNQLRSALPQLLGPSETGDFVLAYAQITRMASGNQIQPHVDSASFGDVIVTVGLTGNADVMLTRDAKGRRDGFASKAQRVEFAELPDWLRREHTICEGEAYVLYGCVRWKYQHAVWAHNGPTDPAYGSGISRVAVTLRYVRRSFCIVRTRQLMQPRADGSMASPQKRPAGAAKPPTKAEAAALEASEGPPFAPDTLVEARVHRNSGKYPFTYPALVLGTTHVRPARGGSSSALIPKLSVQFLCDRRTAADASQAAAEYEHLDVDGATRSAPSVVARCVEEHPELQGRVEQQLQ